jgi:hypothetical protein
VRKSPQDSVALPLLDGSEAPTQSASPESVTSTHSGESSIEVLSEGDLHGTVEQRVRELTTLSTQTVSTQPGTAQIDLIRTYGQYADVLEAPRIMHEVVAMQMIATVLNMNGVTIPLGGISMPLDFWVTLLSGSGFGRSTLVGLAQPVLQMAGMTEIEYSAFGGSAPAVYQQLAEQLSGVFVWGELSEIFKLLNDPRFLGVKPWLTDRYDNIKTPKSIKYRVTGKKGDTPQIVFTGPPRMNILGTSSEAWFFTNLVHDDSAGGFVPRWMLVRAQATGRIIPIPKAPDPKLVHPLAYHLQQVAKISGVADLSKIKRAYSIWYKGAKERFSSQPNGPLAEAYFNRHRGHILKLAVIYEASSSLSLQVSKKSWARAVEFATHLEETIFSLLATGMSGRGYNLNQMIERVRIAGPEGLPLSEFTRAFQNMDKKQRDSALDTLVTGEQMSAFKRKTSGRTAAILVHSDYAEIFRTNHPDDIIVQVRIR